MAGSLIWAQYTDDETRVWNVKIDETTAGLAALGWEQGVSSAAKSAGRQMRASGKRQPVVMRYLNVAGKDADDRVVTRKLPVGSPVATVWLTPGAVDFSNTIPDYSTNPSGFLTDVVVTSLIGEQRFIPIENDTGIIDGTEDDPA